MNNTTSGLITETTCYTIHDNDGLAALPDGTRVTVMPTAPTTVYEVRNGCFSLSQDVHSTYPNIWYPAQGGETTLDADEIGVIINPEILTTHTDDVTVDADTHTVDPWDDAKFAPGDRVRVIRGEWWVSATMVGPGAYDGWYLVNWDGVFHNVRAPHIIHDSDTATLIHKGTRIRLRDTYRAVNDADTCTSNGEPYEAGDNLTVERLAIGGCVAHGFATYGDRTIALSNVWAMYDDIDIHAK